MSQGACWFPGSPTDQIAVLLPAGESRVFLGGKRPSFSISTIVEGEFALRTGYLNTRLDSNRLLPISGVLKLVRYDF